MRGSKLKAVEVERGSLHEIIPQLANAHGTDETARLLGVSQFTVLRWLKSNGYAHVRVWVKQENPA